MDEPLLSNAGDPHSDPRRDNAVAWLMGRINFERVAVVPYNERQLKLDRMRRLLRRLGSPDAGMRIVHIAGTKGKGSTAAMIASVLTTAGMRTGVYSSPHLDRIEERFSVDGLPISSRDLAGLVDRLRPAVEAMDEESQDEESGQPTFFDITTAMALVHFADQNCEAVVLEVGLGGRLDSTNVCLPAVSVITSISLDHTKQLGDTTAAIAREKAGIIKPGVPVVTGVTEPEPRDAIAAVAREHGCRLLQRGRDFAATGSSPLSFWRDTQAGRETLVGLRLGLLGAHQIDNAAVALAVIGELRDQGWAISTDACLEGLAAARLPARVEWFEGHPPVVIDSAHNQASAAALAASLEGLPSPGGRTLIAGISRDKDLRAICRALAPAFDRLIATQYIENPRAVPPDQLAEELRTATGGQSTVIAADSPQDAWRLAHEQTPADGLIVVAGSFFIAAELRPLAVRRSKPLD